MVALVVFNEDPDPSEHPVVASDVRRAAVVARPFATEADEAVVARPFATEADRVVEGPDAFNEDPNPSGDRVEPVVVATVARRKKNESVEVRRKKAARHASNDASNDER